MERVEGRDCESGIYLEGFGFYLVLMVMVNIFSDILLVVCKWMIWVFC